jgi:predicted MFS family arabinose efflux permease
VLDKPYDFYIQGGGTVKTNGKIGPELTLGLIKRNAFRGGEQLKIDLVGSIEWQTSGNKSSIVNSYEYGIDASLKMPLRELQTNKRALSLDRFFLLRGWMLGLNMAFFGLCYGVLSNYLAIYGKEVMGITSGTGAYFMLLAIGLMLSRLTGGRGLRKGLLTHNASEGMLLSTVGYTLFVAWPGPVGYYGSAILIGLGNGHMWPAFQNMMIGIARTNERGTANSTILTCWDLGQGIGILFGGFIVEYIGYSAAFWWVVLMHVVGVVLFFAATRHDFNQKKNPC